MLNEDSDEADSPNNIEHSTFNIQHSSSPRWRLLYAIVLAELALTILIFYAFTKIFE